MTSIQGHMFATIITVFVSATLVLSFIDIRWMLLLVTGTFLTLVVIAIYVVAYAWWDRTW